MHPNGDDTRSGLSGYPLSYRGRRWGLPYRQSLIALGAAAVAAVYAAGYARTAAAAHRAKVIEAAAKRVKAEVGGFKDGTYSGWGSCPHGRLEATVTIAEGRIVAATISQCFTRYSKHVIWQLPGQVVARQTADVDQISGATQSSDAFYDAVMEALRKAR